MAVVLDATALMAYLGRETGYEKVKEAFIESSEKNKGLLMATINWGEVFYRLVINDGIKKAEEVQKLIETFPIEFLAPDISITKQAALFKVEKKLPYADSFVAALAKIYKAEIITGDNDFRVIEHEIKIVWLDKATHKN